MLFCQLLKLRKNGVSSVERGLVKRLTFKHVWAIGVGAVVGDGIFLLIGEGVKIAGPAALVATQSRACSCCA